VNYRLSPPVVHPAHQEDIIAALVFLKERYGMQEFILVGHSAGACLAFQASHISGCKGIVGAEGIYDLNELVAEYSDYDYFIEDAFGKDKSKWRQASPTEIITDRNLSNLTVLLIQSTEDELLSPRQTERMYSVLKRTNVHLQDIAWTRGTHDTSITTPEFCTIVYNFIAHILKS
jgi:kynurenine formamidase